MVSVCLPSDALSQHLPSYLGFSYLGHGGSKGEKEKKNNLNWQEKTTIDGAEMGIERTFTIL